MECSEDGSYIRFGLRIWNMQVSVRPFRHNEFERFLTAAYPYYASVLSTMAAFFVFSLVFLYHK